MTVNVSIQTRTGQPRDTGFAWHSAAADLAVLATMGAVIGLFVISPFTLEAFGVSYLTSGGGMLAKFHPSTILAVIALSLRCLSTPQPLRTAWRVLSMDKGVMLLMGAVVIAGVVSVAFSKLPVTPLVDTFISPIIFFILIRGLDPRVVRWLALLVGIVMCANAIVGLIELLRGWRLISPLVPDGVTSDPTRNDATFSWLAQFQLDWRATALLGHPLVNGMVTGALILCLVAGGSRWIPTAVSIPLGCLQMTAMAAFGARAATVFTVLIGGGLLAGRTIKAVRSGARIRPRHLALGLLALGLGIVAVEALSESGLFDRAIERFSQDAGSATTRVTMFELLGEIPLTDLMLLPDQDRVTTLQQIYGLEFGIESSWIGLVLNYGAIVTSLIVIGLAAFSVSVMRRCGEGAGAVLLFYFILASGAATMSTKTTSFAMVVCLIFLVLPSADRHGRLRQAGWTGLAS